MDGPRGHHTKVKSNIQRQTAHDVTLMWNLKKYDLNELVYKTELDPQT